MPLSAEFLMVRGGFGKSNMMRLTIEYHLSDLTFKAEF